LATTNPDSPHEDIFDFEVIFALDHEHVRAACLERRKLNHPPSVPGFNFYGLALKHHPDFLAVIRPSPNGNLLAMLQNHVIGEQAGPI
jgi:hypothetical protein